MPVATACEASKMVRVGRGLGGSGSGGAARWDGGVGARDRDASHATACATGFGERHTRSGVRSRATMPTNVPAALPDTSPGCRRSIRDVLKPSRRSSRHGTDVQRQVDACEPDRELDTASAAVSAYETLARHARGVLQAPAGEQHHRPPDHPREADLRQGAPLAADRHDHVGGGDHREVAGVAEPGRDRHVGPLGCPPRGRCRGAGPRPCRRPRSRPGRRPPSHRTPRRSRA